MEAPFYFCISEPKQLWMFYALSLSPSPSAASSLTLLAPLLPPRSTRVFALPRGFPAGWHKDLYVRERFVTQLGNIAPREDEATLTSARRPVSPAGTAASTCAGAPIPKMSGTVQTQPYSIRCDFSHAIRVVFTDLSLFGITWIHASPPASIGFSQACPYTDRLKCYMS